MFCSSHRRVEATVYSTLVPPAAPVPSPPLNESLRHKLKLGLNQATNRFRIARRQLRDAARSAAAAGILDKMAPPPPPSGEGLNTDEELIMLGAAARVLDELKSRAVSRFEWHMTGCVELDRWLAEAEAEAARQTSEVKKRSRTMFWKHLKQDDAQCKAKRLEKIENESSDEDEDEEGEDDLSGSEIDSGDEIEDALRALDAEGAAVGSVRWAALWKAEIPMQPYADTRAWPTMSLCAYLATFASGETDDKISDSAETVKDTSRLGMLRRARTRARIVGLSLAWGVPWLPHDEWWRERPLGDADTLFRIQRATVLAESTISGIEAEEMLEDQHDEIVTAAANFVGLGTFNRSENVRKTNSELRQVVLFHNDPDVTAALRAIREQPEKSGHSILRDRLHNARKASNALQSQFPSLREDEDKNIEPEPDALAVMGSPPLLGEHDAEAELGLDDGNTLIDASNHLADDRLDYNHDAADEYLDDEGGSSQSSVTSSETSMHKFTQSGRIPQILDGGFWTEDLGRPREYGKGGEWAGTGRPTEEVEHLDQVVLDAAGLWQGRDLLTAARDAWELRPELLRLEVTSHARADGGDIADVFVITPDMPLHSKDDLANFVDTDGTLTVRVVLTMPRAIASMMDDNEDKEDDDSDSDSGDTPKLKAYCFEVLSGALNTTAVWDRRSVVRVVWARPVEPASMYARLYDDSRAGDTKPPRAQPPRPHVTQCLAAAEVESFIGDGNGPLLARSMEVCYALIDVTSGRMLQHQSHPKLGETGTGLRGNNKLAAIITGGGAEARKTMTYDEARDELDFVLHGPHAALAPTIKQRDQYVAVDLETVLREHQSTSSRARPVRNIGRGPAAVAQ